MFGLRTHRGQTMVETAIALPFFLLFVFGLLQLGQLAYALVTVNYAASRIASSAVRDQKSWGKGYGSLNMDENHHSGIPLRDFASNYNETLKKYMAAGMYGQGLRACVFQDNPNDNLTGTLKVWVSGRVRAFPIVGPALQLAWQGKDYKNPTEQDAHGKDLFDNCKDWDKLGPFYFNTENGIYFTVRGRAEERVNYGEAEKPQS